MAGIDDKVQKSSPVVWIALIVTVLLTLWMYGQEDESIDGAVAFVNPKAVNNNNTNNNAAFRKVRKKNDQSVVNDDQPNHGGLIDWAQLDRSALAVKNKNLFKPHSWEVIPPPPKVAPPPPPPPPSAPPVPFQYMGRLENGPDGNLIYLSQNDKSYSVKVGSNVNGFWRIDKEDTGNIYFTYLPLNLPKVLSKSQTAGTSDNTSAFGDALIQ